MAENDKQTRGPSGVDVIAIITVIGFCASLCIFIMQIASDWRGKGVRELAHYFEMALFLCGPWLGGIAVAVYLANRKKR
jgi:hypothetical protein